MWELPLSSIYTPPVSYPLAPETRAGADSSEILFLPLLSDMVGLPVVVTRGFICTRAQVRNSCKTKNKGAGSS